jgi:DNA-binding MarR family transcriptional regulator
LTVAGRLQLELQQNKPFAQVEEEAHLNIRRTADILSQLFSDLLAEYELTGTQYNVLRILRGAGDAGLSCKEIGARMVRRDPDITRLLDRLEKRELTTRIRSRQDRRALIVRISPGGLALLKELDSRVQKFHKDSLQSLGSERLHILIEILEEIRTKLDQD